MGSDMAMEMGFPWSQFGHQCLVSLTWGVMLGPGHEGDARLGSGFKVTAELSVSGAEAGGEVLVAPVDPGRKEGHLLKRPDLAAPSHGERGASVASCPGPCPLLSAALSPNQSQC